MHTCAEDSRDPNFKSTLTAQKHTFKVLIVGQNSKYTMLCLIYFVK